MTIGGKEVKVPDAVKDDNWLKGEFISVCFRDLAVEASGCHIIIFIIAFIYVVVLLYYICLYYFYYPGQGRNLVKDFCSTCTP